MKEIIIGRNGTQKVKISAEGVSGQHASLTIRDDGQLVLKDLDSTNGTYIRNEKFQFERIGVKVIKLDTVIRFGNDDSIRSFQCTANQLFRQAEDRKSPSFLFLKGFAIDNSCPELYNVNNVEKGGFLHEAANACISNPVYPP